MNFMQWKGHAAREAVGKITYICGDQPLLVELVVDDIRNVLKVTPIDFLVVDSTAPVWDLASQYSLDPEVNRLVIVRAAEKFTDWSSLTSWLRNRNSNNYIVFVSSDFDAPVIYAKGKKVGYQEHIEVIRSKGKFIRCSLPNDEDLIAWAKSYGLTDNVAQHLIMRTSRDTSTMFNILRKMHVWQSSPNTKVIDLLCEEQALESFADYLVTGDKSKAYLCLTQLDSVDKDRIISRLDNRLDLLQAVGKYARRRMYPVDIASTTGISVFLVKKFLETAKNYEDKNIRYCRQLLAIIDNEVKSGATVGTYEGLIALWNAGISR